MIALHFDKAELGNLQYSLKREMLATNRAGGYMSTTLVGCNTRKYHGLMVTALEEFGGEDYVLLSSLDETIIQHGSEFNLAIHRYNGNYEPRGHKYIVDFNYTPTPTITYRVGGVMIKKELLWVHSSSQLMIRYTLLEAHSATRLRLRPFLAFRSRHELSKANLNADTHCYNVQNGIKVKMYKDFPFLHMQLNKEAEFVCAPHWHYNFEYIEEIERGYDGNEDLLTHGYFECDIEKGESIVFSASLAQETPNMFVDIFNEEISRRSEKTEFLPALRHSARQFLIHYQGNTMLNAGYHWYNPRSRETFMSLGGCTLAQGMVGEFEKVLNHHVGRLKDGLFGKHLAADTQLWFFYCLQQLSEVYSKADIWRKYKGAMEEILNAYRDGTTPHGCIRMDGSGLIWASLAQYPLTWMRGVVNSIPITRRPGYTVEVNALWYNAVCYAVEAAKEAGDETFVNTWGKLSDKIKGSFVKTFWIEEKNYLADYVYEGYICNEIRPNQLLAVSLDYSPLDFAQKGAVLTKVKNHLFTVRGIRTLSPKSASYKGTYSGNHNEREHAAHQGTSYVWLLEHYVKAGFEIYGDGFYSQAEEIVDGFKEDLLLYGIGTVGELYDGDPPHKPGGVISYAPSVGAILNIDQLINKRRGL